jgi:hypothetical protein
MRCRLGCGAGVEGGDYLAQLATRVGATAARFAAWWRRLVGVRVGAKEEEEIDGAGANGEEHLGCSPLPSI